jgi:hypothetical protein
MRRDSDSARHKREVNSPVDSKLSLIGQSTDFGLGKISGGVRRWTFRRSLCPMPAFPYDMRFKAESIINVLGFFVLMQL